MAVRAGTSETYANTLIREDLQEAYSMISPEECPFQQAVGRRPADSVLFEWPVVDLAAPDGANRVAEGEGDVTNDAATLALRFSNYTQISDKVAEISHTAQAVDAAAENIQRLAKQVVLKMKEMKRDKEVMLLSNVPALPASSGTPRQTAGLPAFIRTNTHREAGGADPTLSGTTEGFPDAGATDGTVPILLSEDLMNDVIEKCWNSGAEPTLIMCNSGNKRRISKSFTGNSTRYKDSIDKTLVAAIDFYDSDFGELTVVPNRFQPASDATPPALTGTAYNVFILDPEYARVAYLDEVQQKPLAETGHALRTLVWCEYGLQVDNEAAHGVVADTNNLLV
jgi:hypothetical protein